MIGCCGSRSVLCISVMQVIEMEFLRSKKFKKRREYNKRVTKRYVRIYSTLLHVTSMCSIFEASGFYI
jgi:hypothetical protein